jgi:long-chain acyl-CoA synthetase
VPEPMPQYDQFLQAPFATYSELIECIATDRPDSLAVIADERSYTFAQLNDAMNKIAASLQRDAVLPTTCIAILANSSFQYIALFLGALRAGIAVAPLAPRL